MEVYIEVVIFNNFIMTLLIAFSTQKILRCDYVQQRKKQLCLAIITAIVGTIFCVMTPLLDFGNFSILFKLVIGIMLGLVLAIGQRRKILMILVFFIITFAYGGVILGINYLRFSDFRAFDMPLDIPIGIIGISAFAFYFILSFLFKIFYKKRAINSIKVESVEVTLFSDVFVFHAIVDTGNCLYDNGRPVNVISIKKIKDKLDKNTIEAIEKDKNMHFIEYSTASNARAKMPIIYSSKIVIHEGEKEKTFFDMPIGIVKEEVSFEMLLHPSIC